MQYIFAWQFSCGSVGSKDSLRPSEKESHAGPRGRGEGRKIVGSRYRPSSFRQTSACLDLSLLNQTTYDVAGFCRYTGSESMMSCTLFRMSGSYGF